MDLQSRKLEFIQEFLKIQNEDLMQRLENVLKNRKNYADDSDFQPMTVEELQSRIETALDDSKNGRMTSQEDLLKEMKTWK